MIDIVLAYIKLLCLKVGILSKGKIALLIIATIAIILVALLLSGTVPVLAKGSVIVTLTDEETGKPIGRVNGGYVRVMLGGVDQGYLTDEGELKIEGVTPDTHELVLIIPHYGEKRQFVEVGSGQTVTSNIVVDMPNPIFQVAVECNTHYLIFWEDADLSVTLTNIGNVNSRSTSVLVIVHQEDDLSYPIATHMINFPSLVPRRDGGTSETQTWHCDAFVPGPKEIITTVVFDGWEYTPQNEQVACSISVPSSMLTELTSSITNYLANNPELVVETISKILVCFLG
jgi:hypothetical protein